MRGLGKAQGSQQWVSTFLTGGMPSMIGPSHQGMSVARCPAWRVSRWVLGTAGALAGQVLRVGSSVGTEAGVFTRGPGCPWVTHAWMALATSVNTSRLGLCRGP